MGQVVTIDGPAASGKTSVSRELARRLGWKWVSTGAFYRGLGYVAFRSQADLQNEEALVQLAKSSQWQVQIHDDSTRVMMDGQDVTQDILREEVGEIASKISHFPRVREALITPQRQCAEQTSGLVAEGRDCGTVVFPSAKVKIYLTARQESRAERRAKDFGLSVEETVKSQSQRDQQDSTRKAAPLQIPEGSFVVDTTTLNFQQVVDLVEQHVRKSLNL